MTHRCGPTCSADCRIAEEEAERLSDPLEVVRDAFSAYRDALDAVKERDQARTEAVALARAAGKGWRTIGKAAGMHFSTVRGLVT